MPAGCPTHRVFCDGWASAGPSHAPPPISRPALIVTYRNKRHRIAVLQINDREREMVEQIAPRSVQILRPALRRLTDRFERFDNLQNKCRPRVVAAFAIPLIGGLNLSLREIVDTIRLTSCHRASAPRHGAALRPRESGAPSLNEGRPRAV